MHELSRRFNVLQFEDLAGANCSSYNAPCLEEDPPWYERVVIWHKALDYKLWRYSMRMKAFVRRVVSAIQRAQDTNFRLVLPPEIRWVQWSANMRESFNWQMIDVSTLATESAVSLRSWQAHDA